MKQGDHIEVSTDSEKHVGIFVKEDSQFLFLKLKSGYNIGIDKSRIKDTKHLESHKESHKEEKHAEHKEKKSLPTISLLHTGGTIASKVDYETGAVVAKFTPEEIITLFPEISETANIRSSLISNIMSENMRFHHYNIIAQAVLKELEKDVDGVIITHGTDFLHYTAAALSFMFENLDKPIIIIGSQRSSDRPSTDSAMNLMSAIHFINKAKTPGVFVCLHENINDDTCLVIEGPNARKMHTSRRDAFRPINKTAIARVTPETGHVEHIGKLHTPETNHKKNSSTIVKLFDEHIRIGLIKVHPHMHTSEFSPFKEYDGILIEGAGIGHAQIISGDEKSKENDKIKQELTSLSKKMPIALAPQTLYGRVNMNIYSPGRELLDIGIIGNYCDMTPETAYIKLAWLVSNFKGEREKIKELFETNLRGEISERSEKETFLI